MLPAATQLSSADPRAVVHTCEFCREFGPTSDDRFRRLYGESLPDRVVDQEGPYVAVPTLGALFDGSLLILPLAHCETMSEAWAELDQTALERLVARAQERLRGHGQPVLFEHGARAATGGACGIYHAHLHVVPVPSPLVAGQLLPDPELSDVSLWAALDRQRGAAEYLLASGTDGLTATRRIEPTERAQFPSQYFRRRLVELYGLTRPWDWREDLRVDPALVAFVHEQRGR